jgi:type I restriction enzyme S subunit
MKLGDIITLRKGNTIEIQNSETYRISGVQNYGKGVVVRREVKGAELTMRQYQVIEPNQLMWCKVDTKNGAFGITHSEHTGALASPNMALADINLERADPSFLETLFRVQSFADYITHLSSGTTNRKYLTPRELLRQVTLPDWGPDQQRAFVSKLRKIEECGLAHEITHQQSLLAKLKQAILQEAIQGKLTADWRAANPDVEPASQLLQSIQAEKARLIAAKKLRPEKPLPKIAEDEIPFEIPKGWVWCRFGAVVLAYEAGSSFKCEDREVIDQEWGVIKTSAITSGNFLKRENKFLCYDKPQDVSAQISVGDLIFCRASGSKGLAGTCAIVRECDRNLLLSDKTIRVPLMEGINQKYIALHNHSPHSKAYFNTLSMGKSTSMNNVTRDELLRKPIPLPPLAEQAAIVERVEALMATCRALEAEIEQSRAHAAHLLQAVLKEAFAPAS